MNALLKNETRQSRLDSQRTSTAGAIWFEYEFRNWPHFFKFSTNKRPIGAVVVAQLVERSFLAPEVHGSNPSDIQLTINSIEKTTIKKKRTGMAHFYKAIVQSRQFSLIVNYDSRSVLYTIFCKKFRRFCPSNGPSCCSSSWQFRCGYGYLLQMS